MNCQTISCTSFNTGLLETAKVFEKKCSSVAKRKRIPLSTKYEIIQHLKNGETFNALAKEYNLPGSTIRGIEKRKDILEKFYLEREHIQNLSDRMKLSNNRGDTNLTSCLEMWYSQNCYLGNVISGKMLQEKALEFNIKLNGTTNFKASSGWLQGFKNRCGIKKTCSQDEKSSINSGTAFEFKTKFSQVLKKDKYLLENVYSAEENILWWKTFSKKTEYEKNAPKITLVVSSNAAGTHKVPLMIIGRSKIPWSLADDKNLAIKYTAQESSRIDNNVFMDWLKTIFVPSIKERQQKDGREGSIVLLLDSAASRFVSNSSIILSRILIKFVFLPVNLTADLLPMNQGIIAKLKGNYRQNFANKIAQKGIKHNDESVDEFLKTWNLRDSCQILKSSWEGVPYLSLVQSWRAVCTEDMILRSKKDVEGNPKKNPATLNVLKRIPDHDDCSEFETINMDENSSEYDDEKKSTSSEHFVVQKINNSKVTSEENEISNEDAVVSMEKVFRWIQQQNDFKKDISYVSELYERIKEKVN